MQARQSNLGGRSKQGQQGVRRQELFMHPPRAGTEPRGPRQLGCIRAAARRAGNPAASRPTCAPGDTASPAGSESPPGPTTTAMPPPPLQPPPPAATPLAGSPRAQPKVRLLCVAVSPAAASPASMPSTPPASASGAAQVASLAPSRPADRGLQPLLLCDAAPGLLTCCVQAPPMLLAVRRAPPLVLPAWGASDLPTPAPSAGGPSAAAATACWARG